MADADRGRKKIPLWQKIELVLVYGAMAACMIIGGIYLARGDSATAGSFGVGLAAIAAYLNRDKAAMSRRARAQADSRRRLRDAERRLEAALSERAARNDSGQRTFFEASTRLSVAGDCDMVEAEESPAIGTSTVADADPAPLQEPESRIAAFLRERAAGIDSGQRIVFDSSTGRFAVRDRTDADAGLELPCRASDFVAGLVACGSCCVKESDRSW
jgi:hypothetical protein